MVDKAKPKAALAESPKEEKESKGPGKTAPLDPPKPEEVNSKDLKRLTKEVIPARGMLLARLIPPAERQEKHGFSKNAKAFQSSVLLEAVRYNKADDTAAREIPLGSLFFASLEEIAPLLNTYIFLVPLTRIQGSISKDAAKASRNQAGFGFHNQ